MADGILNVRMLGGFSLEKDGRSIDDSSNRMRKVWLLLAYLIYSRKAPASQNSYFSLLQNSGGDDSVDPNGRLKALFFRVRSMLNQMDENAGHDWIIRKSGTYAWNADIPMSVDAEEFEQLCSKAKLAEAEEDRLALYLQALALYRGDFLPKLSMESWVVPIAAYYHRVYIEAVEQTLLLLEARSRWAEAAEICEAAVKIEPYSEELYQHLMRCRIALDDRVAAQTVYEEMSELLFSSFGVMPSEESRKLFSEAMCKADSPVVPASSVPELLREAEVARGAMYCEYDFFRLLYQVQARAIIRSGEIIHVALFSVRGENRKEVPRRSLERAMDNLQELLVGNLRQGDVVTRCSISQLIAMLPQANYENSCKVCQRVIKAFRREYPHSPVEIHYSVQPLEPMMPEQWRK